MQRIPVNFTYDVDGYQLNNNNDLLAIGNKNYALQKPFETNFLTVIGNAKLRLRSLHIFLCKIICDNYFIVKFIKMYSLICT